MLIEGCYWYYVSWGTASTSSCIVSVFFFLFLTLTIRRVYLYLSLSVLEIKKRTIYEIMARRNIRANQIRNKSTHIWKYWCCASWIFFLFLCHEISKNLYVYVFLLFFSLPLLLKSSIVFRVLGMFLNVHIST